MKTRILFVIQQLKRSEEAVALLERLYRLSPKRYAIDLYVPSRGGELMRKVPPYVSITAKPPAGEYDMAAAFAGSQKAAEYVAEYAHAAKTYLFLFTVLPDPSWKRQPDFTRFDQIYTASNAVKAALLRLCPALGAKTCRIRSSGRGLNACPRVRAGMRIRILKGYACCRSGIWMDTASIWPWRQLGI